MLQVNFRPFPRLETDRMILREMTKSDVPELFFLRSDATVLKYLGREPAKNLSEVEAFIDLIKGNIDNGEGIQWALTLKDQPEKLIGTICFWNMQKEHFRSEIGYALHPEHWSKGLMKEAILCVLDYGFATMKLHSVEARLAAANAASAAVLESTGFIKEGHFKQDFYFNGKFDDTLVYSKLTDKK